MKVSALGVEEQRVNVIARLEAPGAAPALGHGYRVDLRVVVSQQDEKSQHKNKAKALKVLRARLFEAQRQALEAERSAHRRSQVGSGDRSERVRTYNFPQGRVTDHRIGLTLHKIDKVMSGESLDEIIDALTEEDQAMLLATLE